MREKRKGEEKRQVKYGEGRGGETMKKSQEWKGKEGDRTGKGGVQEEERGFRRNKDTLIQIDES